MENLTPVKVDINIETATVEQNAFYNMCFIAESDIAPREIKVNTLSELLDNGYTRLDLVYNFCVGVFAQQSMPSVYIRAKRSDESYIDAYDAGNNDTYYFIVLQTKDVGILSNFNNYLVSSGDLKLHFYSQQLKLDNDIVATKSVNYYQKYIPTESVISSDSIDYYLHKAYGGLITLPLEETPVNVLQQARLAYPESAWVSDCGNSFPSKVQWLHRFLSKVDTIPNKLLSEIPFDTMYTTTSSIVMKTKATTGSGKTSEGIPINEQVSLDWVKWAISKKVWNLLYSKGKVNATDAGKELILNEVKYVLGLAVEEGIFTTYNTSNVLLNSAQQTISIKFTAETQHTILAVDVVGSLYQ